MEILRTYRRLFTLPMITAMILPALPHGTGRAAMISTDQVIAAQTRAPSEARAHVMRLLRRSDVQAEMRALGVDPAEAAARVTAMSDSEIQRIAGKIGTFPAGGDTAATIALVASLVALTIGLLVALLVYYLTSPSEDVKSSPPPRTN